MEYIQKDNKITTKTKDLWECKRCNFNTHTSKGMMIPCPRGGCEAEVIGEIVITREVKIKIF